MRIERMVLWISASAVWLIVLGTLATAHTKYDLTWDEPNTDVVWKFQSEVSGAQKRDSIIWGANRWDSAGGADFIYTHDANDETNNYGGYTRSDCAPAPNSDVHWDNSIPDATGFLAVANACDTDQDNVFDELIVVFDSDATWELGSDDPAPGEADLRWAAAHEFGHAWGFDGHFTGSTLCPENSTKHTMCDSLSLGEQWGRTLETHDSHTLGNAY